MAYDRFLELDVVPGEAKPGQRSITDPKDLLLVNNGDGSDYPLEAEKGGGGSIGDDIVWIIEHGVIDDPDRTDSAVSGDMSTGDSVDLLSGDFILDASRSTDDGAGLDVVDAAATIRPDEDDFGFAPAEEDLEGFTVMTWMGQAPGSTGPAPAEFVAIEYLFV